jgi:hypothetical protein
MGQVVFGEFMSRESEVNKLVSTIRDEFRILGAVTARGLALITVGGNVIFSDMSPEIKGRLNVFIPSLPALGVGSNITVNIGDRFLLIIRVSEKMVLAIFTDQRIGVVLTRATTIMKKYGEQFDKIAEMYEGKSTN